jgi:hypothetical protein
LSKWSFAAGALEHQFMLGYASTAASKQFIRIIYRCVELEKNVNKRCTVRKNETISNEILAACNFKKM